MRAEVVSCESQPDNQTHVTKNALFIAKNGICELRVKAGQCLGLFQVRLDYRDMDGVIGVAGPYSRHSNQLGSSLWRSGERKRKEGGEDLQSSSPGIFSDNCAGSDNRELSGRWSKMKMQDFFSLGWPRKSRVALRGAQYDLFGFSSTSPYVRAKVENVYIYNKIK